MKTIILAAVLFAAFHAEWAVASNSVANAIGDCSEGVAFPTRSEVRTTFRDIDLKFVASESGRDNWKEFIPILERVVKSQSLNVRSYEAVTDAYITNSLHYYIRDEKTIDSMRTIISNPYFDLSLNFGGRYGALAQNTAKTVIQAAETGLNVLDVHYWYYFGALGALEEIKNAAK